MLPCRLSLRTFLTLRNLTSLTAANSEARKQLYHLLPLAEQWAWVHRVNGLVVLEDEAVRRGRMVLVVDRHEAEAGVEGLAMEDRVATIGGQTVGYPAMLRVQHDTTSMVIPAHEDRRLPVRRSHRARRLANLHGRQETAATYDYLPDL